MTTLLRAAVLDNFRQGVLWTLDNLCRDNFAGFELPAQPGAIDSDLPELFRAIDAHVERLAVRHGVELINEEQR